MKRSMLVYALFATATAALAAQQASQYSGTSAPPPDTSIVTDEAVQDSSGRPPAGVTGYEQPAPIPPSAQPVAQPAPLAAAPSIAQPISKPSPSYTTPTDASTTNSADGTDDGIVIVAPSAAAQPELNQRDSRVNDPDGDIVHPAPLSPGELGYGATIRVRLLDHLSTATSETGETFRTRVASDVMQDGQVLIPAGAEIEGKVVGVSYGRVAGRGSMHLRPEAVILSDGSRFHLYAQLSGAPGSSVRINGEGGVSAGSQLKKDSIEYGSAMGAGAITGAILGGPGGALAGTIIGAGAITVHLLVSHPQATLDRGTVLLFTLDQPLNLVPAAQSGN